MKRRGFTLVELLVVIAIIGLLATFAVAQLAGSREKARLSKGIAQSGQILRATGDDLIGRWDFDECSGATAVDSSGYAHPATFTGGVGWTATSPDNKGCSLTLNGTDAVVNLPTPALGSIQTKTMWVYFNNIVNRYLVDQGGNNNFISIGSVAGKIRAGTTGANFLDSNTTFVTGKWYFIATSYDGSKYSLYVDGSLDKSATFAGQTPAAVTHIGVCDVGGGFLNGNVADIRLYGRALTGKEIHQMYVDGASRHVASR